jgi:hypothetical protein
MPDGFPLHRAALPLRQIDKKAQIEELKEVAPFPVDIDP